MNEGDNKNILGEYDFLVNPRTISIKTVGKMALQWNNKVTKGRRRNAWLLYGLEKRSHITRGGLRN